MGEPTLGCLLQVFPQINYDVLKEIAISYVDDADAAAEFILRYVLPNTNEFSEPSSWHDEEATEDSSLEGLQHIEDSNILSGLNSVHHDRPSSDGHTNSSQLNLIEEGLVGERLVRSLSELDGNTTYVESTSEQNKFHGDYVVHSVAALGEYGDRKSTSAVGCNGDLLQQDVAPLAMLRENDIDSLLATDQYLHELNGLGAPILSNTIQSSHEVISSITEHGEDRGMSNNINGFYQQSQCSPSEENLLCSSSKQDLGRAYVNDLLATTITRSCHFVGMESLDNSIADAKTIKNNLLSSMELVNNMLAQVELQEAMAKQAKDEACNAGQDILVKVEELMKMSKHAREEYDMRAGEVFGEKSILATEAQELQSRLQNISEERTKSLSIIQEMHKTLESRLATAKDEIAAAEKEKLEREAMALEAFNEQKLLLDAMMKESKLLEQQAQENPKLREFLMDRGRVMDALQGEMLGIFGDIMLLKERVDGHLLTDKPLPLVSSSLFDSAKSSVEESNHLSDGIIQHVESGEKITNVADRQFSSDCGGWDIVDDEAIIEPLA